MPANNAMVEKNPFGLDTGDLQFQMQCYISVRSTKLWLVKFILKVRSRFDLF